MVLLRTELSRSMKFSSVDVNLLQLYKFHFKSVETWRCKIGTLIDSSEISLSLPVIRRQLVKVADKNHLDTAERLFSLGHSPQEFVDAV